MHIVARYTARAIIWRNGAISLDGSTVEVFSLILTLQEADVKQPQLTLFSPQMLQRTVLTVEDFLTDSRGRRQHMEPCLHLMALTGRRSGLCNVPVGSVLLGFLSVQHIFQKLLGR
jgi:hypothetical protein